MKRIRKLWYSLIATVGLAGIWYSAMSTIQPVVPDIPIPLVQVATTKWVMTNGYSTAFSLSGRVYRVTIKEGFVTDLASLGRADKPLGVSRDAPCIRRGATIHDALYATRYLTQDEADMVLYLICLEDGMERSKAQAVYQAVRTWGWLAWEAHDLPSVAQARKLVTLVR